MKIRNEYGFEPTPRMSTYQLGWALHDFVSSANSSQTFRMWTRGSMNNRGTTALNYGKSIYSSLKNWISIEDPIPKMDQFAVPDFNFHAMENWGMITYRESVVLYEDGITPTRYMIDGIATMAHEYAHTWFGNLVTPVFWDVAWLKEGFASYFQYFAVSMVEPSWGMMEKFVVDVVQPALLLDSGNHSRVMNGRNVGSPGSIMAVLDFVSYKKGSLFSSKWNFLVKDQTLRDFERDFGCCFILLYYFLFNYIITLNYKRSLHIEIIFRFCFRLYLFEISTQSVNETFKGLILEREWKQ